MGRKGEARDFLVIEEPMINKILQGLGFLVGAMVLVFGAYWMATTPYGTPGRKGIAVIGLLVGVVFLFVLAGLRIFTGIKVALQHPHYRLGGGFLSFFLNEAEQWKLEVSAISREDWYLVLPGPVENPEHAKYGDAVLAYLRGRTEPMYRDYCNMVSATHPDLWAGMKGGGHLYLRVGGAFKDLVWAVGPLLRALREARVACPVAFVSYYGSYDWDFIWADQGDLGVPALIKRASLDRIEDWKPSITLELREGKPGRFVWKAGAVQRRSTVLLNNEPLKKHGKKPVRAASLELCVMGAPFGMTLTALDSWVAV